MASHEAMLEALDRSERRVQRMREKDSEATTKIVTGVSVVAGGVAAGYADGRWPDKNVLGLGVPAVAGAALVAVDLMGWAGKATGAALSGLGYGMLAGTAYRWGFKQGQGSSSQPAQGGEVHGMLTGRGPVAMGPASAVPSGQSLINQFQAVAAGR